MPNATTFIIEQVLNGWNGSVAGDLIETVVVTQSKHGPFERVKPSNPNGL